MSEFYVNACDICNKNDHDEHLVFHNQGICKDCHTIQSEPVIPLNENNVSNVNDDDENEVFGDPTTHLCDACGESIDGLSEQVYYPGIFCPDCLVGMGEAYEKRAELEYRENINKIANYMPIVFEKLREIERNTNPTNKSFYENINQNSINSNSSSTFSEDIEYIN